MLDERGFQPPGPEGFRFLVGLFWLDEANLGNLEQFVWSAVHSKSSPVAVVPFLVKNSEQTIEGTQEKFRAEIGFGLSLFFGPLCPLGIIILQA